MTVFVVSLVHDELVVKCWQFDNKISIQDQISKTVVAEEVVFRLVVSEVLKISICILLEFV